MRCCDLKIPRFNPHINPTRPDQSDTAGRNTQRLSDHSDVTGPLRPFAPTSRPDDGTFNKVEHLSLRSRSIPSCQWLNPDEDPLAWDSPNRRVSDLSRTYELKHVGLRSLAPAPSEIYTVGE